MGGGGRKHVPLVVDRKLALDVKEDGWVERSVRAWNTPWGRDYGAWIMGMLVEGSLRVAGFLLLLNALKEDFRGVLGFQKQPDGGTLWRYYVKSYRSPAFYCIYV